MNKKVISILVENKTGVLARVSSLFCQRGFNIDSLTVSATDDESISRITVVTDGDHELLMQILKQTAKLEETRSIFPLNEENSLFRELLLVKVQCKEDTRRDIYDMCNIFGGKIIDLSPASLVIELTGTPRKIDGLLRVLAPYNILEMCRTGITAIERGAMSYALS